jgi:hypothetical protein
VNRRDRLLWSALAHKYLKPRGVSHWGGVAWGCGDAMVGDLVTGGFAGREGRVDDR